MTALIKSRNAQYPLVQTFSFDFNDTMVDAAGVTRDFGSLAGGSSAATVYTFKVMPLPRGARVIGGYLVRDEAFDTAGYDVTVGDTASANRYLTTTDVKGAGVTALTATGYKSDGEDIVITVSTDDACTTGKATLIVQYERDGFTSEVAL
jgi:hypothetical protein